jgi:hypothetical protein
VPASLEPWLCRLPRLALRRARVEKGTFCHDRIDGGWPPYRALCRAIAEQGVAPHADDVVACFGARYAPYTPYARSLFSPNKTEGLLRLYRVFGLSKRGGIPSNRTRGSPGMRALADRYPGGMAQGYHLNEPG